MVYPSWNEFLGKNPKDPEGAFEALCRLLFRNRFGIADSLPYFYNHPGIETSPVEVGSDIIGFQSKFLTGETIDDSQAELIIKSIKTARKHNSTLTKIILYTNSVFWFPKADEAAIKRQRNIEAIAQNNNIELEWMFGDNILDLVSKNELAYNLFFNLESNIGNLPKSVALFNRIHFSNIDCSIKYGLQSIELNRENYVSRLKELIYHKKNVIISGESGSGKSAISKLFWEKIKEQEDLAFYFVPAQQLNARSVNDAFLMDENYSYAAFKNFYSGHTTKIIVVDSAEKLLEQHDCITPQLLLEGLAEQDWQFIFTCKSNCVDELLNKLNSYSIETEGIRVEGLSEEELNEVSKKYVISLPTHDKIKQYIRIPFYLARYCELGDSGLATVASFRESVWNQKVRGIVRGGEQLKREECLISVVKELQGKGLYIASPQGLDYDIAYKLVKEDILVEHPHKGYSVKHDLYTDWALDYVVERDFETPSTIIKTLAEVPVSLSYSNSFRRWLDGIIDQNDPRVNEIINTYVNGRIHQKWEHYILASIGQSEQYATIFFNSFEDQLTKNDYILFDKFVDVLYVACQKVDQTIIYKGEQIQLMKPIGQGWDEAVLFVDSHQKSYYMDHLASVLKLLTTYSRMGKNAQAMKQAALLTLRLYNEVAQKRQQGESFWIQKPRPWSELICKYAYGIRSELEQIFKQIIVNKWTRHTSPYAELVAYILKEANTISLYTICLCCKDYILELLNLFWLEIPEEEKNDGFYFGRRHSGFDREYVFGLNGEFGVDMGYFPVSAQQTPLYALFSAEHLLDNKGMKVLDFVIKFMNTCVGTYTKRNDVDKLRNITVTLPDGTKHDVIASTSLWNLYRGTPSISMPNLLECMHMALESFLFSLVENEKQPDWDYVEKALWMILLHSKSASLYAVAASLAVAYPVRLYDILLFLCQDIRFISMDLTRSISEQHATSIEFAYHRHPSLLEERKKSNKQPHRQRCLETTLFNCQVAFDQNNDVDSKEKLASAYAVVDRLREQKDELKEIDSTYKFIFERIDYRSMKKEDVELKNGQKGILLTPNSTPEMEKERAERQAFSKNMEAVSLRVWADKKYKNGGGEVPEYRYDKDTRYTLEIVRAVEKQVTERDGDFLLMPGDEYVPYIGSAMLLLYYADQLSIEEKEECWQRLMEALCSPRAMISNSLSEVGLCMSALPAAMNVFPERKDEYAQLIAGYVGIKDEAVNKRLCDIMSYVIAENDMWHTQPDVMEISLERLRLGLPEEDFALMDENQADAVLCLLTHKTEKRNLGRMCIEKMSYKWQTKDHDNFFVHKSHEADQIAMYLLHAPKDDVPSLIAPYVKLVGRNNYDEPLMTSLLLCAAQYEKYENFWIAWYELYPTIIYYGKACYYDRVLNEYLFNPMFLMQNYDDWFRLEEKDLDFFKRVVHDIGNNPLVLFDLSKVFATIGRNLQKQSISLFANIVENHQIKLMDEKETIVFYLEKIVKRVRTDYADEINKNQTLRNDLITVLEFLRENDSTDSQLLLNNL